MLDRATAYVEPGASLFFRRIEKPTCSRRSLQPSFWSHGAENRPKFAWWPAYPQDPRDIAFARNRARLPSLSAFELLDKELDVSGYAKSFGVGKRHRKSGDTAGETRHALLSERCGRRTFSISWRNRDSTNPVHAVREEALDGHSHADVLKGHDAIGTDGDGANDGFSNRTASPPGGSVQILQQNTEQASPPQSLRTLLASDEKEAYSKAWQLFISVGGQAEFAGDVLEYLSTSCHRVDMDHALRAYKLLPALERRPVHYQTAIKVACRQKMQNLAVEIHHEAFERGFHGETANTLIAFLVRSGLWKTAAQVWERLPASQRNAADPRNRHLWSEIDNYSVLPEKMLQLMERLEQNAPVYASTRSQILGLGVQLLYRIFSSSEIMASITGSGTLALLDRFYNLDLLTRQHYFSGIQTLNKMAGFRNRHQLATLLYRNLDSRFPEVRLPRSVLGSLIAILCESNSNHLASRVVLRRFATDWIQADGRAYQKVLSACAQNADSTSVREVFREFCECYGKPLDLAYITPLLQVHARMGNVSATKDQFDRLRLDFGIEPTAYCWNILISAHARARDHEGAFQAFRNMKLARIKPDHITYETLMAICARSGDTEAVYQLVDDARQQKIPGTCAMIDKLVHSYCFNDQLEDAENLVESATQMRLQGSLTRMWNTLLRHHALRADTDAVLRTQERMKELSVPADDMTYAALMQALANIGKTADAAKILRALHFSRSTTVTIFHYSIVLYGYVLEGNRDMVAVIYREMSERFPRVSLSARLSRLRSYLQSDQISSHLRLDQSFRGKPMPNGLRLSKTLDFLAETLLEVNQSDLASNDPQPGLGRRSPQEAFPAVYLEFLIGACGRSGALKKAEILLDRYQALMNTTNRNDASTLPSINLLTSMMITLVQQKRFARVDMYWNKALSVAIDRGRHRPLDLSGPLVEAGTEITQPTATPPDAGDIGLPLSVQGSVDVATNPFLGQGDTKILAAHRYSLAAPLTQYMHSLGAQNLAANLPPLVNQLLEMGFSLTSKNWNHYVQILSYSNRADLQLLAFRTFEEKLLPNMPPWQLMKRGKWSQPKLDDGSDGVLIEEPVERKVIERFRPFILVPTYWTMVYLGRALMNFQLRETKGQKPGLSLLRSQAPGTVSAVSQMPYLREKAQGLLLRRRNLQGEVQKRPRRLPAADRAGLRGSRSALDHISLNFSHHALEKVFKPDQLLTSKPKNIVEPADQLVGEILRSPLILEAAGRYEREREYRNRMRIAKRDRSRLLEQMREDSAKPRVMAGDKYGEPFFEAKLPAQQTGPITPIATDAWAEERQKVLETALRHFVHGKKTPLDSHTSKDVHNVSPAARHSVSGHRRAFERLVPLRGQGKIRPAVATPPSNLSVKQNIKLAMIARQPRQRVSNRVRKAFTKNKAARQLRHASRQAGRSKSKTRLEARQTSELEVNIAPANSFEAM